MKGEILSQNQSAMQTSAQLGGILLALLTFILAFFVNSPESLKGVECQSVVLSLAVASISFFTATTYYLRGTTPMNDIFILNCKGDVFFAFGLLCLLAAPLLLFYAIHLYLPMIVCSLSYILAWTHLFFSEDGTGIVAFRLTILGLSHTKFDEKMYKRCHNIKIERLTWNWLLIVSFYLILSGAIILALVRLLYPHFLFFFLY